MNNDRNIIAQEPRVFDAFRKGAKTMFQVARETGVERANICRYVAHFRDAGTIYLCYRGICPVSRTRAAFLTTNPQVAINGHIHATRQFWVGRPDEDIAELWRLTATEVHNHYTGASTRANDEVSALWELFVEPFIIRRVGK